jgi:hypothetical protein
MTMDPLWYKDAIIYQLHVKAFADSNKRRDRRFRRPDREARLSAGARRHHAVAAAVLSLARRDDGYDIADYGAINPDFGTMKDFKRFIAEAKRRGLRVITELVINHTSDQHDWFQRARRSPPARARATGTSGATPTRNTGRAHHLHRHGEVELDLGPGSRPVLLAPLLQPPARPEFRQSPSWSARACR